MREMLKVNATKSTLEYTRESSHKHALIMNTFLNVMYIQNLIILEYIY